MVGFFSVGIEIIGKEDMGKKTPILQMLTGKESIANPWNSY